MNWRFVFRNLYKRPVLNIIKVIGLSLALSCILLIVLFLKNEHSYDRLHDDSDRIFRLTITNQASSGGRHFARIPNPGFVPELSEYFPEIENYVRLSPIRGGVLKYEEHFIDLKQGFTCDSTFFAVFKPKLLVGNPETILKEPATMLLSERFANQIFGNANPVGEIIIIPRGQFYGDDIEYTITGIMADFPQNSHFHPDLLATTNEQAISTQWAWTYLLLQDPVDVKQLQAQFRDFFATYTDTNPEEVQTQGHLQRITDIHLQSKKLREIENNSNLFVVYTLSLAALIVLLIALINYANLNIGMARYTAKYFLVNRVLGGGLSIRFLYYGIEGLVIAALAVMVSGVQNLLLRRLLSAQYGLDLFAGGGVGVVIAVVVILFIFLSVLFGMLPLLWRSVRKGLIVLQYAISIALIIGVIVVQRQTTFALDSGLGVQNSNLICIDQVHADVQADFALFKDELLKHPAIQSVSAMLEPPGGEANDRFGFRLEGYVPDESDQSQNSIGVFPCDYSFTSIFGLTFLSGRDFSPSYSDHEGSGEYIINRAALKQLQIAIPEEIIGKSFALLFQSPGIEIPSGEIIAVVEDFHLSSVKKEIEPLVLFKRKGMWLMNFVVAPQPGKQTAGIKATEQLWSDIFPAYPFRYRFVSDLYEEVYRSEILQARLLLAFTIIALVISSMGLLGLSLLITQRRTKEIGVRKVHGATTGQIVRRLNWFFIRWIFVSFILAVPIAYFCLNMWLDNFAYRMPLSWWVFALAGGLTVVIALITVSIQSWKAASQSPVTALRYE